MDFGLSEEQGQLRDETIEFARNELSDDVAQRDREQRFAHDLWRKCGERKLQGLCIPENLGGRGFCPQSTAVALEALGYGCSDSGLVFSLSAHLLSCVVPIWKHGSDEQQKRLLPGLCNGSTIAVNAMSEPQAGSDAFAMETTAMPDGDGFRIRGIKTFATNGPIADVALVYALTDRDKGYFGGVTAFLVEKEADGYRAGANMEKVGLRTVPFSELHFDDVYVPPEAVLGRVGGGAQMFAQSMDWERTLLFAGHVGTMQRLLEQAVEHARTRKQFGQSIGKFQAVSHRIADMKVRLEAARLLVYSAASKLEQSKSVSLDAAIAKLFVSESLVQTALETLQVFGAYGIRTDTQVERALRDSAGSTIYSGTSEMQRNIISKWLGL